MTALATDLTDSPMVTVTEITVTRLDACDIDDCTADAPVTVTWDAVDEPFGSLSACWPHHRTALARALDDAADDTVVQVELCTVPTVLAVAA
ncbi:hypothetical protein ACFXGA_05785 [Actinosynnema sp. NPDC059335]|uniref:hypothetical protein n=1 Tax=Actinosynnema sp. NPDC059335 TaxID=3346804 RepID=UPI003671EF61